MGLQKTIKCEMCGKERITTKHHLIPRAVHSKKRFQRKYSKQQLQRRAIYICCLCHNGIHDIFSEKTLAESYNTRELLLADERIQKHIEWSRKQKV